MTMSPMRLNLIRRKFFAALDSIFGGSFRFNSGLIYEHNRDFVFNWINTMAFYTFDAFFIRGKLDISLAYRAGKNFQQFFIYRHYIGTP